MKVSVIELCTQKLNCTQRELAKKLGVSEYKLSKWKYDSHNIDDDIREKIIKILEVNIENYEIFLLENLGNIYNVIFWKEVINEAFKKVSEESKYPYEMRQSLPVDEDISVYFVDAIRESGINIPDKNQANREAYIKFFSEIFEMYDSLNTYFRSFMANLLDERSEISSIAFSIDQDLLHYAVVATWRKRNRPYLQKQFDIQSKLYGKISSLIDLCDKHSVKMERNFFEIMGEISFIKVEELILVSEEKEKKKEKSKKPKKKKKNKKK